MIRLLLRTTRQLLLCQLHQTFGDVSSQRTGFAGSVVPIITVSWDCYSKLLCCFIFQLLQRCSCLWNDQVIGTATATLLTCLTHVCSPPSPVVKIVWALGEKFMHRFRRF